MGAMKEQAKQHEQMDRLYELYDGYSEGEPRFFSLPFQGTAFPGNCLSAFLRRAVRRAAIPIALP